MIQFETNKLYSFKDQECKSEIRNVSCRMNTSKFEPGNQTVATLKPNDNIMPQIKELSAGDKEPFYFVSEMKFGEEHPIFDDTIFTKEWADSFVLKLDDAPFPLSQFGHVATRYPLERAENDGYVVGGLVEGNSMYLLNYLLPGETEQTKEIVNKTKREIHAGMLSTSISNSVRVVLYSDEDTGTYQWYAIESLSGQRNDIVEHDLTGGDAAIISSLKENNTDKSVNLGENQTMEKQTITKSDMLTKLKTLKDNGDLSSEDLAKAFNLKLKTNEDETGLVLLTSLKKELGEGDPLEIIKTLKGDAERANTAEFDTNKTKALDEVFKNKDLKDMASELFVLKSGNLEDCQKEVKRVVELKALKGAASKSAGSMTLVVGISGDAGSEKTEFDSEM